MNTTVAATSQLSTTLLILNCILLAMPLGLINLALTASKCSHRAAFAIHAAILAIASLTAIALMTLGLPPQMAKSLAPNLPLLLLLQTIVLYFTRSAAAIHAQNPARVI